MKTHMSIERSQILEPAITESALHR